MGGGGVCVCVCVRGGGALELESLEGDEAGQRRGEGRGPGRPDVVAAVCVTLTHTCICGEFEDTVHQCGHLFESMRGEGAALRPHGRRERRRYNEPSAGRSKNAIKLYFSNIIFARRGDRAARRRRLAGGGAEPCSAPARLTYI